MTLNDFITNLSGLSDDGKDFPKELLKVSKPFIFLIEWDRRNIVNEQKKPRTCLQGKWLYLTYLNINVFLSRKTIIFNIREYKCFFKTWYFSQDFGDRAFCVKKRTPLMFPWNCSWLNLKKDIFQRKVWILPALEKIIPDFLAEKLKKDDHKIISKFCRSN